MPKSKAEQNAWAVPDSMAEYIEMVSNQHLKNEICRKPILEAHPVPWNIRKTPELDAVTKGVLQKNKSLVLSREKTLGGCQSKVRDVLGPISKLWAFFDAKKMDAELNKNIEMEEICSTFEQAVMLLGQAQVSLQYERRMMVLEATGNHERALQLLKDHKQILEVERGGDELFGKEFRAEVRELEKQLENGPKALNPGTRDPFQKGSSSNYRPGGGHYSRQNDGQAARSSSNN